MPGPREFGRGVSLMIWGMALDRLHASWALPGDPLLELAVAAVAVLLAGFALSLLARTARGKSLCP